MLFYFAKICRVNSYFKFSLQGMAKSLHADFPLQKIQALLFCGESPRVGSPLAGTTSRIRYSFYTIVIIVVGAAQRVCPPDSFEHCLACRNVFFYSYTHVHHIYTNIYYSSGVLQSDHRKC